MNRRHLKLFWAGLGICFCADSLRADDMSKQRELELLTQTKSCIETLNDANRRYQYFIDNWFNDKSEVDIATHFMSLQNQHKTFYEDIAKLSKFESPVPTDLSELAGELKNLETAYQTSLTAQSRLIEAEAVMRDSLYQVEQGLDQVGGKFTTAKKICGPSQAQQIDTAIAGISSLRERLLDIRQFMQLATEKRSSLFRAILEVKKARLTNRFNQQAKLALSEIRDHINGIFAADLLVDRIHRWWSEAALLQGTARGEWSTYLNYTNSLRVLRADYQTGIGFRQELATITPLSENIRQSITATLELYVKQIRDLMTNLESGGYQKIFERQQFLSGQRRKIWSQYSQECQRAIDSFDQIATAVNSYESFRSAEAAYRLQAKACTGEQRR
jgi:hypothetical protein